MKIGFYCESPADRAAMAVFTEGILGEAPEPISMDLEAHSVPAFFNALPGVFTGVHYNSDAEGLIIVVDCDDKEPHDSDHDAAKDASHCRLCQVYHLIAQTRQRLKRREGRPPLKVAIGLPVPAIEAWYLVGKNAQVGEAAWWVGLKSGPRPFTRPQLKQWVYETDRPSLELETACAVREARRVIQDIQAIEAAFPAGFGSMAAEIRSWKAP